jgi:hypothetical protein
MRLPNYEQYKNLKRNVFIFCSLSHKQQFNFCQHWLAKCQTPPKGYRINETHLLGFQCGDGGRRLKANHKKLRTLRSSVKWHCTNCTWALATLAVRVVVTKSQSNYLTLAAIWRSIHVLRLERPSGSVVITNAQLRPHIFTLPAEI